MMEWHYACRSADRLVYASQRRYTSTQHTSLLQNKDGTMHILSQQNAKGMVSFNGVRPRLESTLNSRLRPSRACCLSHLHYAMTGQCSSSLHRPSTDWLFYPSCQPLHNMTFARGHSLHSNFSSSLPRAPLSSIANTSAGCFLFDRLTPSSTSLILVPLPN